MPASGVPQAVGLIRSSRPRPQVKASQDRYRHRTTMCFRAVHSGRKNTSVRRRHRLAYLRPPVYLYFTIIGRMRQQPQCDDTQRHRILLFVAEFAFTGSRPPAAAWMWLIRSSDVRARRPIPLAARGLRPCSRGPVGGRVVDENRGVADDTDHGPLSDRSN